MSRGALINILWSTGVSSTDYSFAVYWKGDYAMPHSDFIGVDLDEDDYMDDLEWNVKGLFPNAHLCNLFGKQDKHSKMVNIVDAIDNTFKYGFQTFESTGEQMLDETGVRANFCAHSRYQIWFLEYLRVRSLPRQ